METWANWTEERGRAVCISIVRVRQVFLLGVRGIDAGRLGGIDLYDAKLIHGIMMYVPTKPPVQSLVCLQAVVKVFLNENGSTVSIHHENELVLLFVCDFCDRFHS